MKARFEVQTEQEDGSILVEEKVVKAKLLIGADGIRSQVRKVVVGDEPRDLLLITWNAIVPTDPIRSTLNLNVSQTPCRTLSSG